jgi:hypothetical protein
MKDITEDVQRPIVRFDNSPQPSPKLPPLKLPAQDITDPGIVRLGNNCITSAR